MTHNDTFNINMYAEDNCKFIFFNVSIILYHIHLSVCIIYLAQHLWEPQINLLDGGVLALQ